MWTTNVIYTILHAKFSRVLPYVGLYLRFLVFFKYVIDCDWWVHILFEPCPLFKGCLFHILVGLSLLYHLYRPLRDYMKIGDLAKIPLSNPQMKQITKLIKGGESEDLFHLWVNNKVFYYGTENQKKGFMKAWRIGPKSIRSRKEKPSIRLQKSFRTSRLQDRPFLFNRCISEIILPS